MKISDIEKIGRAIEQGEHIGDLPGMPGVSLHVRGLRNTKFVEMENKLVERATRYGSGLDAAKREQILTECMMETVLLGWDGLAGDDGEPIPYERELAAKMLSDPYFQTFKAMVIYAANKVGDSVVTK